MHFSSTGSLHGVLFQNESQQVNNLRHVFNRLQPGGCQQYLHDKTALLLQIYACHSKPDCLPVALLCAMPHSMLIVHFLVCMACSGQCSDAPMPFLTGADDIPYRCCCTSHRPGLDVMTLTSFAVLNREYRWAPSAGNKHFPVISSYRRHPRDQMS